MADLKIKSVNADRPYPVVDYVVGDSGGIAPIEESAGGFETIHIKFDPQEPLVRLDFAETVTFDAFEPSLRSYVWWDDDGPHQFLRTWVHYPNKSSVSISRGEPCEEFERQSR